MGPLSFKQQSDNLATACLPFGLALDDSKNVKKKVECCFLHPSAKIALVI
jgi:hypothetical protein